MKQMYKLWLTLDFFQSLKQGTRAALQQKGSTHLSNLRDKRN
jgi:hypothetical protein